MSAEIIAFRPDPDPDWAIDSGDFPNTAEGARALGASRRRPGAVIRPLAHGAAGADLAVYFKRRIAARPIALRSLQRSARAMKAYARRREARRSLGTAVLALRGETTRQEPNGRPGGS